MSKEDDYICPECGQFLSSYDLFIRHMEEEQRAFMQQSAIGTVEDMSEIADKNDEFQCINWYDCSHCPAARAECFK